MRVKDITPAHERLLRSVASRISNGLETEFSEIPDADSANVGVILRERNRHVVIGIPHALLIQAADDPSALEAIRVRIKARRDRMLFHAPPKPLPKHIAPAATPGSASFGWGGGGGGFRGRR